MSDDTKNTQTDPINREAERERVQFQNLDADPLEGGGQGSAVGPTGVSTTDHKIRASQNEATQDIAAQRRDVVGFSNADHQHDTPDLGEGGDRDDAQRHGGNAGGETGMLTDAQNAATGSRDERSAQQASGVDKPDEGYDLSTNSGDKAAPYNNPGLPMAVPLQKEADAPEKEH